MQRLKQILKVAGELAIILTALFAVAIAGNSSGPNIAYTISTAYGGGSNGDAGPAIQGILNQPEGIVVDVNGNIYVADADDHRIRRISPDGVIRTFAGTGVPGFSGDGGSAADAQLNTPYGLCIDAQGNIYVADLSNARVRRISPDGKISTVAGGGSLAPGGSTEGSKATQVKLGAPRNVALDNNGALYISDFSGQRIHRVLPDGTITTVAGTGSAGYSGDGGSALAAKIAYPSGVSVDAKGAVYFADSGNKRIRRVYKDVITTVTAADGKELTLEVPTGIAMDRTGNIYIQDGRSTTTRITPVGQVINIDIGGRDIFIDLWDRVYTTRGYSVMRYMGGTNALVAGAGTRYFAGDGGPAAGARFNAPLGLFRDSTGNLYIADSANQRVRRITAEGTLATIAGTTTPAADPTLDPTRVPLGLPSAVAMNSRGELFIADTAAHRIRRIALDGSMTTVAGVDEAGYKGDGWFGTYAALNKPVAIAFDKEDNLYIADSGNNRIRKLRPVGTLYTIAGGNATDAPDGTMASESKLTEPSGVAVDSEGNIYVADTGANRIRVIDSDGRIRTIAEGSTAGLNHPTGLRVTDRGELIVADTGNHRVVRIAATGSLQAIAGSGKAGFSGDDGPAALAAMSAPADVLIEPDGSILISDSGNARIRKLMPESVSTVEPPATVAKLSVMHGATYQEGPVAAGQMVSLFGLGLGPDAGVQAKLTDQGTLETAVAGTQVLFDGRPAALFYAQSKQVNAQVPYEVYGRIQTDVSVVVNGTTVAAATVPVRMAVPGLLTAREGNGQAIALNQDGTANSFENPAVRGSVLVLYGTGDGEMNTEFQNGKPAGAVAFRSPVAAAIGGKPVEVLYAGKAPGLVGLMQINVRIPSDFPHAGILDITLTVNGETTQKGVTVVVR